MLKNAPNQADDISLFQLCLLLKMRLSVDLEGRYIGYECLTKRISLNSILHKLGASTGKITIYIFYPNVLDDGLGTYS